MTIKKITKKLNRIIDNAEFMYNISGWEEDGKIYQAFGEGGFPIRLTPRQVHIIADYLSNKGYHYWLSGAPDINPKETYILWVNIRPKGWLSCSYEYRWGCRRVTESPTTPDL